MRETHLASRLISFGLTVTASPAFAIGRPLPAVHPSLPGKSGVAKRTSAAKHPAVSPIDLGPVVKGRPWHLNGGEILLELSDVHGQYVNGIYAWDAFAANGLPQPPRLLIAGARRPEWSPHHRRLLFEYAGSIGIADTQGNVARLWPALPAHMAVPGGPLLQWQVSGSAVTIMRTPSWGSKVLLGSLSEQVPIAALQNRYDTSLFFDNVPIIPRSPGQAVAGTTPTHWREILTTNSASTSPDGKFMAAEVYPAAPMDLLRNQSRIEIFPFRAVVDGQAGDAAAEPLQTPGTIAPDVRRALGNFLVGGLLPPLRGPGRRLTTLQGGTVETDPLWSPTGEWIAFTVIDFGKSAVIPYVIHPDGSALTPLIDAPHADPATGINMSAWGDPHVVAVQWSSDGKTLWLNGGPRDSILAARQVGEGWKCLPVSAIGGTTMGILLQAFNGSRAAWLFDAGEPQTIEAMDIDTKQTRQWKVRAGVEVNSMAW